MGIPPAEFLDGANERDGLRPIDAGRRVMRKRGGCETHGHDRGANDSQLHRTFSFD
jgi:hypothetical protein